MNGYRNLAAAIIEQAVDDFDKLIRRVPKKQLCIEEVYRRKRELNKIMRFFRSPWCGALLTEDTKQGLLVQQLEKRYKNSVFARQAKEFERAKA